MAKGTPAAVRTFGLGEGADVRATDLVSEGVDGVTFTLVARWGSRRVRSAAPGRHLVPHALAAAAVAEHFAVPLAEVAAALEAGSRAPHRMAIEELPGGATLVDDTYNASPVSVSAALAFLAETPVGSGRRLAVLGDMLELGPDERVLHERIGVEAAAVLDGLVAVGERGAWIAEAARTAGLASVATAPEADAALAVVDQILSPTAGDVLLVKGSRGIALDRLVAALIGRDDEEH
jgi:UDP-N-acetylmuramoyl-tripeptide--D-alanyl-D-alanine ligase